MDSATILAIIILVIAILILIYYYLQSTNNPIYQNIHAQAAGFSSRVGQEEYVANISDKLSDFSGKVKDRVQDDEENDHVSKTDLISKKIDQFINEQSEQVINDWDLATHKDLNDIMKQFDILEKDLNDYKENNDNRVDILEERLNRIDEELKDMK